MLTRRARRVNTLTAPPPSQPVRRADHTVPAAIEHARVDHRRRDVFVPKQFLHRANVVAGDHQIGGEAERAQRDVGRESRNRSSRGWGTTDRAEQRYRSLHQLDY